MDEPTPGRPNLIETVVLNSGRGLPGMFALKGNWPNPFNGETLIGFDLFKDAGIFLEVFDVLGRKVAVLCEGNYLAKGSHFFVWNGHDLNGFPVASGTYFYELRSGVDYVAKARMMLIR